MILILILVLKVMVSILPVQFNFWVLRLPGRIGKEENEKRVKGREIKKKGEKWEFEIEEN